MSVQASVVIPAYNASRFIVESIGSVIAQENAPTFEIIVVDDGSLDGTADLVEESFPTVRVIRKVNGGPGSARNLGVQNANSDIILFHDADDLMLKGRVGHQVAFMISNPHVAVSFGSRVRERSPDTCQVDALNLSFEERDFVIIANAYQRMVSEYNIVIGTSAAIRRSVYLAMGGQPEDIMVAEDHALYMAIARDYPIAVTRRKYTWYRQSHGTNLMASESVYVGCMTAVGRELEKNFANMDTRLQKIALANFNHHFNRFARYAWAYEGRIKLNEALKKWKPFLNIWMRVKWRAVPRLVPSSIGRSIRSMKHTLRRYLRERKALTREKRR